MIQWIIKNRIISIVLLLMTVSAVYGWYREPDTITKKEYVKVPVDREVVKIKRVEVPVEKVIVIEKKKASKELDLPEEIKTDKKKQVTSAVTIPPYEGETSVVAVLDTDTGITDMIAKKHPLPLFAIKNQKELGIRYGMNAIRGMEAQLFGRWTFLRIGNFHGSVYGEMNSQAEAKGMLEVSYKF